MHDHDAFKERSFDLTLRSWLVQNLSSNSLNACSILVVLGFKGGSDHLSSFIGAVREMPKDIFRIKRIYKNLNELHN